MDLKQLASTCILLQIFIVATAKPHETYMFDDPLPYNISGDLIDSIEVSPNNFIDSTSSSKKDVELSSSTAKHESSVSEDWNKSSSAIIKAENSTLETKGTNTISISGGDQQYNSTSSSISTSHLSSPSVNSSASSKSRESSNSTTSTQTTSEFEEVVIATKQPIILFPKRIIQKTIEWMSDAYTLSILVPVAAGVTFACTIIVTVTICNCIRRRCCRRKLRRKVLPDSVKGMRSSDRARLLAESSDEEF